MRSSESACCSSRRAGRAARNAVWLLLTLVGAPACALIGIEPDEIDVADDVGETGTNSEAGSEDDVGTTANSSTGDVDSTDGMATDGNDSTDTADPDSTGTGTSTDTGGDTDTGAEDCDQFSPAAVILGDNPVTVIDGASAIESDCGGVGPELVLLFEAPADGDYGFTLTSASFAAILDLGGPSCVPFELEQCASDGSTLSLAMTAGDQVFVVVDSDEGGGEATLTITNP